MFIDKKINKRKKRKKNNDLAICGDFNSQMYPLYSWFFTNACTFSYSSLDNNFFLAWTSSLVLLHGLRPFTLVCILILPSQILFSISKTFLVLASLKFLYLTSLLFSLAFSLYFFSFFGSFHIKVGTLSFLSFLFPSQY